MNRMLVLGTWYKPVECVIADTTICDMNKVAAYAKIIFEGHIWNDNLYSNLIYIRMEKTFSFKIMILDSIHC